jgi:hypothetical protein
MEGVSLEAYAKISAKLQTGAVVEQLVAAEGLSMDQWQRGQAAWVDRMGKSSPTDPLIVQYGQLYQKWSPNQQASMEAATAAILAEHAEKEGRGGGMSEALDLANADAFFSHGDVRVRARGVREMVRIWELQEDQRVDPRMRRLTQAAYDEAIRILVDGAGADRPGFEALTQAPSTLDIHAWSALADQEEAQQGTADVVYGPLKDLAGEGFMTPQQNDAARQAVQQAVSRLARRSERVTQVLAEVTDELMRTQARSLADDYRETLDDMREALDEWEHVGPQPAAAPAATPQAAPSPPASDLAAPRPEEGILALLRSLPIIGPILRLLGL